MSIPEVSRKNAYTLWHNANETNVLNEEEQKI